MVDGDTALDKFQGGMASGADRGRMDRLATAAVDEALDAIVSADRAALSRGAAQAKMLHDVLGGRSAADPSAAYLAGRMGTLADMLGLAAARVAVPSFEAVLAAEGNRDVVRYLHSGPARASDLAMALGVDRKVVGERLRALSEVGALAVVGAGSRATYSLTTLAHVAAMGGMALPAATDR